MKENKKMNSLAILLVLAIGVSLIFSLVPSADAATAGFSPVQPNAFASYNNSTNEVQVEWDFTTGGVNAPENCLLKGDFWFFTDLNNAYNTDQSDSDDPNHRYYDHLTKIKGFTPIHYSVVSSSPTIVGPEKVTEVIPCQGSTRINLDTVMSHSSNVKLDGVTPHQDLQIFLSFYALAANTSVTLENFDFQTTTMIDQIFVAYTSNDTWSGNFKNYACASEPGNVLYIDQSGSNDSVIAHGNNGDNCDKYLYIENDQYVDIGGSNNEASPVLADGEISYGDHDEAPYPLMIKTSYYLTESEKKGGGCGGDCTSPTFGKDKKGIMIVQGGFSFNGNSTDVTELWTPYHMITAQTNSTHNFTLKVFENNGVNNIKWFQLGIVPEVGSELNDAEVLATIFISSTQVEKVEDSDKNNLWDIINATSYIEECGYVTSDCLELSIDVIFREELRNKVIIIQAMDNPRNADTKFLNDGIETVGESMNEPLVSYVLASKGGAFYPQDRGVVELTLTSYKNDLWQDPYGYEWSTNNYGFYIISTVPVPLKEPDVMWQAMTRMNSNFADMIIYEQERAVLIFDASKLISVLDETFTHDFTTHSEEQYKNELAVKLEIEADKAAKITKDYTKNQHLYQKNSYNHWNYFGDMTLAEINQLDFEKKLKAQQEVYLQKINAKQQYSN